MYKRATVQALHKSRQSKTASANRPIDRRPPRDMVSKVLGADWLSVHEIRLLLFQEEYYHQNLNKLLYSMADDRILQHSLSDNQEWRGPLFRYPSRPGSGPPGALLEVKRPIGPINH